MERFLKSKFKIGSKLNENIFSLTYNGSTLSGEQPVIIKIYRRGTLNSPLIKSMKQKVKLLQENFDPRVIPLLDGDYGWQGFYYVRPFVEGEPLNNILKGKALAEDDAEGIAISICDALRAAHERGIIHGALTGNNVIVGRDGIKLVDFVIEGEIKESLPQKALSVLNDGGSMSPEELSGSGASRSSDIFAAGMLLYKMLTGQHPFLSQHDKFRGKFVPVMTLPKYLEDILKKSMEPDRLLRFRDISELRESLKQKTIISMAPALDLPVIELENTPRPQEREGHIVREERKKSFFLAAVVLIATLAGILYAIISSMIAR